MNNKIMIFTDGGSRDNGSNNARASLGYRMKYKNHVKNGYLPIPNGTNNMAEIQAVTEGLKCLKKFNIPVEIYSDSAYTVNCCRDKWYSKWLVNGWNTSKKEPVLNQDRWKDLIQQIQKFEDITFYHLSGHVKLHLPAHVDKGYAKFLKNNPTKQNVTRNEYIDLQLENHKSDLLTNIGMNELDGRECENEKLWKLINSDLRKMLDEGLMKF